MENVVFTISDYRHEDQASFERLNRDWIEQYFWMEPIDFAVLQNPEEHILKNGGAIKVAIVGTEVVGVAAIRQHSENVYELTKMAVDAKFRGKKIGRALAEAAIHKASELGATRVVLDSNTILKTAIELYRKLGFVEIPTDGLYTRSNIKMELRLSKAGNQTDMVKL